MFRTVGGHHQYCGGFSVLSCDTFTVEEVYKYHGEFQNDENLSNSVFSVPCHISSLKHGFHIEKYRIVQTKTVQSSPGDVQNETEGWHNSNYWE